VLVEVREKRGRKRAVGYCKTSMKKEQVGGHNDKKELVGLRGVRRQNHRREECIGVQKILFIKSNRNCPGNFGEGGRLESARTIRRRLKEGEEGKESVAEEGYGGLQRIKGVSA